MATSPEEVLSAPKWLEKLEEQREKRLKAKLGHEAGAGAPCQICGDKCPGLDLHFWRKICKVCKCGKEDHDITDDDIYGFVQFTLLGSKPVKAKGILLKGRKDEVILDWTPSGSNHDVKKYLDEIPYELLPVKGSEAAKIRKQRLQKQIPAHDVDASLCHALTDEEIKEMEEYVAHIKNNSVGQGKIIRLPLYKSSQHVISGPNSRLLSHLVPTNLASSEDVNLLDPNLTNNLQNLTMSDKSIIHPLTTTNVERHQEQFEKLENSTFEPTNANLDRVYSPNLNCAPSYINPRDQYQLPVSVRQPKDLKYPVNELATDNTTGASAGGLDSNKSLLLPQFHANFVNPVTEELTLAEQCRQPKDIKYPMGIQNDNHLGQDVPIFNLKTHHNFSTTGKVGMQSYQPQSVINPTTENAPVAFGGNTGHMQDYQPQNIINPTENQQNATRPGYGIKDISYPGLQSTINKNSKMQEYQPANLINPAESQQNLTSVGYLKDLAYRGIENNFEGDNFNIGKTELPPTNLKCHECRELLLDGSIAVTAERSNSLWHAQCFKCAKCQQLLVDLLYFYHKDTDKVYCGRDYALLEGLPRCAACDELIFVREYCLAEESTFHVKHFCCFECDSPLAGKSYVMENNQPTCVDCFENVKANRCHDCGMIISPDQQGVSLEKLHYHANSECFVCKLCRKALLGGKMLLRNNNLFCSDVCYKSY